MDGAVKDARIAWGGRYYRLAAACRRSGKPADALRCFCAAFLLRNSDGEAAGDWLDFFNVQFTSYLLGKRRLEVLLPEGDMVYALIRDRWTALRKEIAASPLRIADVLGWAKTVAIDFPYAAEVLDGAEEGLAEEEAGQDDPNLVLLRN